MIVALEKAPRYGPLLPASRCSFAPENRCIFPPALTPTKSTRATNSPLWASAHLLGVSFEVGQVPIARRVSPQCLRSADLNASSDSLQRLGFAP
jgi:hypothetical protein